MEKEPTEKAETLSELVRNRQGRQLEERMDTALDTIINDRLVPGRIDERFFYNVFLPYFAGKLDPKDFPPGITPQTWVAIAGTHTNSVDVYDAQGKYVVTVPPITTLGTLKSNVVSSRDSVNQKGHYLAELRGSGHGDMANDLMVQDLNKLSADVDTDKQDEYLRQWANIFYMYGIITDEDLKDRPTETDTTHVSDSIVEYDPDDLVDYD